jgi:integrase/recombinase XerD
MYKVLIAADLGLRINPFDTDRVPAPPKDSGRKRPTEMLDYKLVQRVIETPDAATPKGRRDRAILAILFGAGLRRSEVIGLRLGDIRKTQRGTHYLYLRATKAKKDAEQAVPSWALKPLLEWRSERQAMGAKEADYLFNAFTGRGGTKATREPISPTSLYLDFKRYCLAAGVKGFVSPHSARATAITKLLDQGLNHRDVRTFSRHASVQMVEAYDKRRTSVDESPAKDLEFD